MRKLVLVVSLATLGFTAVLGNLKATPVPTAPSASASQGATLALLATETEARR